MSIERGLTGNDQQVIVDGWSLPSDFHLKDGPWPLEIVTGDSEHTAVFSRGQSSDVDEAAAEGD